MISNTILIDLGDGEKGQRRKAALLAIAERAGYEWGGKPSIGRMICAMADAEIKRQAIATCDEMLYAQERIE